MFVQRKIILGLWIAITLLGLLTCWNRPGLPGRIRETPDGVWWEQNPFSPSAIKIVKIEELPVRKTYQIEYWLSNRRIGETITVTLSGNMERAVRLIRHYSLPQVLLFTLLAFLFYGLCWKIFSESREIGVNYFVYAGFLFGYVIVTAHPGLTLPYKYLSYPVVTIYFLSYPFAFVLLALFGYHFPITTLPPRTLRIQKRILIALGGFFALGLLIFFFLRVTSPGISIFELDFKLYRIFRLFAFSMLVLFLINIILNTRREPTQIHKKKLAWILGGIFTGSFPFIFLWSLPQILGIAPIIPEIWSYPFLIIVPVTIAIAILRYNLFDIEIFLSRSLIYGGVAAILTVLYLGTVGGISWVLSRNFTLNMPVVSVFSAIAIAFLFNPLKNLLQTQIDRRIFPIRYDRQLSMTRFLQSLENAHSHKEIFRMFKEFLKRLAGMEQVALVFFRDGRWQDVYGSATFSSQWQEFFDSHLNQDQYLVVANSNWKQSYETMPAIRETALPDEWVLLFRMGKQGYVLLGRKRGGIQYISEEISVVSQMVQALELQMKKLEYFQSLVLERMEKEAAQKISRWKSLLVAEVAHDLRSPLNNILWKLKMLRTQKQTSATSTNQLMDEIEKSISRLQYLVQSLLISADIEKGRLRIRKCPLNLKQQLNESLQQISHLIEIKKIRVIENIPATLLVSGDSLLLQEIFLNLLENSVKFSRPNGTIRIQAETLLRDKGNWVNLTIEDEAGGIPEKYLDMLFKPFEKFSGSGKDGEGFNLGLFISRQFIELLDGELSVFSQPGKGTVFSLKFKAATQNSETKS